MIDPSARGATVATRGRPAATADLATATATATVVCPADTTPEQTPEYLYTVAARAVLAVGHRGRHLDDAPDAVAWAAARPDLRAAVDATWQVAVRVRDERQRRINAAVHLLDTADPDPHPAHVAVLLANLRTVLATFRDATSSDKEDGRG
jgi:hypothetical protein